MKDVAERARVSVSTISHVLNSTRRVSDDTRMRVMAAIEELGYQPNLLARGLKTRKTFTIGLLISDIRNPFFTSVINGVEDVTLSRGYHLFLCNTDEDPDREAAYVRELTNKQVDGLIITSASSRGRHAWLPRLEDVPFVLMDREIEGVEASTVGLDNRAGMELIVEHLMGLGHERIGMISGPLETSPGCQRHNGLKRSLEDRGLVLEETLLRFGDFRLSGGREAALELLRLPNPPSALVVANNQMTLGALLAIRELGLRAPSDVSVVGFDDMDWAPLADPPLTTVAQPTYDMGVEAARTLLNEVDGTGDGAPARILLKPRLMVRESTGPPAAPVRQGSGPPP